MRWRKEHEASWQLAALLAKGRSFRLGCRREESLRCCFRVSWRLKRHFTVNWPNRLTEQSPQPLTRWYLHHTRSWPVGRGHAADVDGGGLKDSDEPRGRPCVSCEADVTPCVGPAGDRYVVGRSAAECSCWESSKYMNG